MKNLQVFIYTLTYEAGHVLVPLSKKIFLMLFPAQKPCFFRAVLGEQHDLNKSGKDVIKIERSKAIFPVRIRKQIRPNSSSFDIIFYFS